MRCEGVGCESNDAERVGSDHEIGGEVRFYWLCYRCQRAADGDPLCESCDLAEDECRERAAKARCAKCAQPAKTCQTLRAKEPGVGLCVGCWVDRYMKVEPRG